MSLSEELEGVFFSFKLQSSVYVRTTSLIILYKLSISLFEYYSLEHRHEWRFPLVSFCQHLSVFSNFCFINIAATFGACVFTDNLRGDLRP